MKETAYYAPETDEIYIAWGQDRSTIICRAFCLYIKNRIEFKKLIKEKRLIKLGVV